MTDHRTGTTEPRQAPKTSVASAGRCPFPHDGRPRGGGAPRKTGRDGAPHRPVIERRGDVWHLRSYSLVRQALRQADAVKQAGFNSETMAGTNLRKPVLFQDGASHKEQRTAIARFFTPRTVGAEYRTLMEELSDELIGELVARGGGDLGDASMALAVRVAAQVVGLTDSRRPGMDHRLDALLSLERLRHPSRWRRLTAMVQSQSRLLAFYRHDVRPAIRARRAAGGRDLAPARPGLQTDGDPDRVRHLRCGGHGDDA